MQKPVKTLEHFRALAKEHGYRPDRKTEGEVFDLCISPKCHETATVLIRYSAVLEQLEVSCPVCHRFVFAIKLLDPGTENLHVFRSINIAD